MAHNKTLAAQLYSEMRELFPNNAVEYFVSYYDYYQPEAYLPRTDTFIEKDSSINEQIDLMRHSATRSLLERRDVIVVSSVSCIYGIGNPTEFANSILHLHKGQLFSRNKFLLRLVENLYSRCLDDFKRGTFRVKGDTIDIYLAYADHAIRIEYWGDEIEAITSIDPISAKKIESFETIDIYPANIFVSNSDFNIDGFNKSFLGIIFYI